MQLNSNSTTLFIHATNIHNGGGSVLLDALLQALPDRATVTALLDERMEVPENRPATMVLVKIKPTIFHRLQAEWLMRKKTQKKDVALCFGNLPPLFKLPCHTIVFVQNRYLIDRVSLKNLSFKTRLRIMIERFWLRWRMGNADEFIVQTPSMRTLIESSERFDRKPVHIYPFVKVCDDYQRSFTCNPNNRSTKYFVYVASGEPHKNHRRLIDAWCLLAQEGLFPSLILTLDPTVNANLCAWIEQKKNESGLVLENRGIQSHKAILTLYEKAMALIYPSTFESFGIPLIEARQAGLPVVASELDYVRDVLDPEQTFDPLSARSIARAVKRFLQKEEPPLPLTDAVGFVEQILKRMD